MKKLNLDRLTVESFATTADLPAVRGTVAGRDRTASGCPDSWEVETCPFSCAFTCTDACSEACETSPSIC
jgi:hypothetical protein